MRPSRPARRRSAVLIVPIMAALLLPAAGVHGQGAASPSADPAGSFTPPSRWARARVEQAPTGVAFADVIAGGPGFIAVGGGWADGADRPSAEIWISPTGFSWTRVPLTGDAAVGQIRAITATPTGFVAVGGRCCPDQALVWRSTDGLTWEVLPDDPLLADAAMMDVAALPDGGLVAVGCSAVMECGGGLSWRSTDGTAWEPPVVMDFLPMGVAAAAGGVVAVGTTQPYEGAPAGATSLDGGAWTRGALEVPGGSLLGLLGYPEGAIAVGVRTDPETLATSGLLAGTDGTNWSSIDAASIANATFEAVLWLGGTPGGGIGGMLLGGWTQDADGAQQPGAWWSTDGFTWEPGRFGKELKGGGMLVALATGPGDVTVAVGSTMLNRGMVPAAWVSDPTGR